MIKIILTIVLSLFFWANTYAQIEASLLVGIHNATTAEINAIANPATGALIFNTDLDSMYTYDGTQWQSLQSNGNETKIVVGDNITLTGTGTSTDPYTISGLKATLVENPNGSYTFSNGVDADVTFTPATVPNTPFISQSDAMGSCANQFQPSETRNVILQGDYFDGSSTVTISGQTVNSVTVNSATQLTVNVTAANTSGDFDVQVTTNGGTGTLPNGFSIKTALTTNNYNSGDIILGSQMSYNSGVLTRASGSGWNQQAYSTLYNIPAGHEGYLRFTSGANNRYRMIALNSDPVANASYTSLDYAIYLVANSRVYVYENGTYKGNFTSYVSGDNFEINVDCDGKVTYLKNGTVFYTSTITANNALYLDSSFYHTLSNVTNISITY